VSSPPPAMAGVVAAKRCMNPACGAAPAGGGGDWGKGWPLRSGGFAMLCDKCGYGPSSALCSACPTLDPVAPSAVPSPMVMDDSVEACVFSSFAFRLVCRFVNKR
jgi:hypothetical protein